MRVIKITKAEAKAIAGNITQTTKMPCKSYSLPTVACRTGFKMAQISGSICSECYAMKGNYQMYANNIEPAQHARLDSVMQACKDPIIADGWISALVALIGKDTYFRWHDSGDLQSLEHLRLIAMVCYATPNCKHWLPTREYNIVKQYIAEYGDLPDNLIVRLSAMYFDKQVTVPASLRGIKNVEVSNVHKHGAPMGQACNAPTTGNKCADCRACWHAGTVSYAAH